MNTPKELEATFQSWKQGKDARLLTLYQNRSIAAKTGKETTDIDEKIASLEKEIDQKKARLERDMLKIFRKMDLGNSREAKDARRERTHKLCQLGGLIEKAGLGELSPACLLGMLIQQKEYLENNQGILSRWEEKGSAILKASEE